MITGMMPVILSLRPSLSLRHGVTNPVLRVRLRLPAGRWGSSETRAGRIRVMNSLSHAAEITWLNLKTNQHPNKIYVLRLWLDEVEDSPPPPPRHANWD